MTEESGIVVHLKKEHERLMREVRGVSAALAAFGAAYGKQNGARGTMSAAMRARISAAQKARWAKAKASGGQAQSAVSAPPKKRPVSAAARKKMAAAQKARWAKVRALKKSA
ncbi:MAG: hypothetical protein WB919_01060 [Candidatus Sulfotelmatobacter sp.]